jgi:hypothetical protein
MGVLDELAGRVQRAIENDRKKVGGMTAGAMGRLGLAELRQATVLDGSVAAQTQTPLGMYGTLTPGEVSGARQDEVAGGEDQEQAAAAEAGPVERARESAAASGSADADRGKGAGK